MEMGAHVASNVVFFFHITVRWCNQGHDNLRDDVMKTELKLPPMWYPSLYSTVI